MTILLSIHSSPAPQAASNRETLRVDQQNPECGKQRKEELGGYTPMLASAMRRISSMLLPAFFVLLFVSSGCEQGKQPEQHRPAAAISRNDIDFPGLQLRPDLAKASYTLIGRIRNKSKLLTVQEVQLLISMEDVLATGASTTVAETVLVLKTEVPPGQSRDINESITFGKLPLPRGRHEWNFSIREIKAK